MQIDCRHRKTTEPCTYLRTQNNIGKKNKHIVLVYVCTGILSNMPGQVLLTYSLKQYGNKRVMCVYNLSVYAQAL